MKFENKIIDDFKDGIWRCVNYAESSLELTYTGKFFGDYKTKKIIGKITEVTLDWAVTEFGSKVQVDFRYNEYDYDEDYIFPPDCESILRIDKFDDLRFADTLDELKLILELED